MVAIALAAIVAVVALGSDDAPERIVASLDHLAEQLLANAGEVELLDE